MRAWSRASTSDLRRFVPLTMKRRGIETRIMIAGGEDLRLNIDPALFKAVARSMVWFEELASDNVRSLAEIARRQKMTRRYVERLSRLAFTAPPSLKQSARGVSRLNSVPRRCSSASICP